MELEITIVCAKKENEIENFEVIREIEIRYVQRQQ